MRILKQFLYLSGGETIGKVVTFLAIAYLARILGPSDFGYVEFASAVLLCASLIVDQGFGPYGAREIAREPGRTAELVSEIVLARFILAAFAYSGVILFAVSLDRPAVVTQLLLIYGMSLLVAPLLLQWVYQGHNRMQTVAVMQVIRQTAFSGVVFVFVRSVSQLWVVGLAELAGVAGAAGYGLWTYRRHLGLPFPGMIAISGQLLREGVPIGLSQMFWMLRVFGATALLGLIASAQDVGFFGAAMRILVAMHAFVWLYFFNLLPSLSRAWREADGSFATLMERSLRLVAWASVLGTLVWVSIAPAAMVSVYGPEFAPASATLQWLAAVCVVAALSGHYRFALIAAVQQNLEMAASAIGALFALTLIPVGYVNAGPSGAAIGLVIAELMVWWSAWWWAQTRLGVAEHSRILARPALVLAVAGGLLVAPWPSESVRTATVTAVAIALALVLDGTLRLQLMSFLATWRGAPGGQPGKKPHKALR